MKLIFILNKIYWNYYCNIIEYTRDVFNEIWRKFYLFNSDAIHKKKITKIDQSVKIILLYYIVICNIVQTKLLGIWKTYFYIVVVIVRIERQISIIVYNICVCSVYYYRRISSPNSKVSFLIFFFFCYTYYSILSTTVYIYV